MTTNQTFESELSELINKYNWDGKTNIPDYIIADYIIRCLYAISDAVGRIKIHEKKTT